LPRKRTARIPRTSRAEEKHGAQEHNGSSLHPAEIHLDRRQCVIQEDISSNSKIWSTIMGSRTLNIDPKKATTSDPDVQVGRSETVEKVAIAARAYELWQERGCPIGTDQEDWFRAE
jgi:hypothetical protein